MSTRHLNSPVTPDMLSPVVIGVAGKIASGKTTLCSFLSRNTGWPAVNLGSYLKLLAGPDFKDNRRALQELGARLVAESLPEVCRGVLEYAGWRQGMGLILDGIRGVAVVEEFRRIVSPTPFVLVYVETPDSTRECRYSDRALPTGSTLDEVDGHYMEQEPAKTLPQRADVLVRGDLAMGDEVAFVINRIWELSH